MDYRRAIATSSQLIRKDMFTVVATLIIVSTRCTGELFTVTTLLGNVTGSIEQVQVYTDAGSLDAERFVQYLSIPYAEPPTGDRRFAKAEVKRAWSSNYNATQYRTRCYFSGNNVRDGVFSEDCLTLDVYAPIESTLGGSALLPVLAFIHSTPGTSRSIVGDVLCAYGKVLVVVINYRQGILGFFSTGDDAARGNFGLWDQMLAIDWINEHISSFGGDSSQITLVGQGTGASDVILHTLYPARAGKFRQIIAMSGTPLPAYNKKGEFEGTGPGPELVKLLNCSEASSLEIVTCLREKTMNELNEVLLDSGGTTAFTPVIDGHIIKAHPLDILTNTNFTYTEEIRSFSSVGMVIGLNSKEGVHLIQSIFADIFNKSIEEFSLSQDEFDSILVPRALEMLYKEDLPRSISTLTSTQYTAVTEGPAVVGLRQDAVTLLTDLHLALPLIKTANIHTAANNSVTFFYEFSERLNISATVAPSWLSGAGQDHALNFVLGLSQRRIDALIPMYTYVPTDSKRQVAREFMKAVATFARTGRPSPDWSPYNPSTSPYLYIAHNVTSLKRHFREPRLSFWTRGIPAVLHDISSLVSEDSMDSCPEELGNVFKVDMLTAENIILALAINAACLLIACIIICAFAIARERPSTEYTVNQIHKRH